MKLYSFKYCFVLIVFLLQCCSVQKRHYLKGWHIERKASHAIPAGRDRFSGGNRTTVPSTEDESVLVLASVDPVISDIGHSAFFSVDSKPERIAKKTIHVGAASTKVQSDDLRIADHFGKAKQPEGSDAKKQLLRSKVAFWMSLIFSFLLFIGPLFFVLGLAIHILSIFNIGFWLTIFVLWTGWLIIPVTLILSNKEARQQKKEHGKKKIFKMLRTGEYRQYQALFARRLMWASLICFLSLFLFVFILAILGIPNS